MQLNVQASGTAAASDRRAPRIGFAGVGWIGQHRMKAMLNAGMVKAAAFADPSPALVDEAMALVPESAGFASFDELLEAELDGIVIATPSAMHADQAMKALRKGLAVFCQKPLGRNASEVAAVVAVAEEADRLLGIDMSYRGTIAMRRVRDLVRQGKLGTVYAADLVFHNAYGPDKSWYYDKHQSGGGCVMDLGVHLVDLALWVLDWPEVRRVESKLFHRGSCVTADMEGVEDFAAATIETETGALLRLACSWNLHAGRDAVVDIEFHGTRGGAACRNVDGSFFDFRGEWYEGTRTDAIAVPPDDWGGRAAVDWASRLAKGTRFDPSVRRAVDVAHVLDRIYAQSSRAAFGDPA